MRVPGCLGRALTLLQIFVMEICDFELLEKPGKDQFILAMSNNPRTRRCSWAGARAGGCGWEESTLSSLEHRGFGGVPVTGTVP